MAQKNELSLANLRIGQGGICPECSNSGNECDTCFFVAKNSQMIESLQIMMKSKPQKPLYELNVELAAQKVIANNDKGKKMMTELADVAEKYSQLEIKTKRAVRSIQSYGKNCQEAAEDFLKNGDVGELLSELGDIQEAKNDLKDVTENHGLIK
jgi:hypothetical protein